MNIVLGLSLILGAVLIFGPMIFFGIKIRQGHKKYWWFLGGFLVLIYIAQSWLNSPIK